MPPMARAPVRATPLASAPGPAHADVSAAGRLLAPPPIEHALRPRQFSEVASASAARVADPLAPLPMEHALGSDPAVAVFVLAFDSIK